MHRRPRLQRKEVQDCQEPYADPLSVSYTHLDVYKRQSPDSFLVKTLLDVYEEHTGKKGECIAIGGGTYVHGIEAVSYTHLRCIVVIDFLSVFNLSIINSGLQSNFYFNILT